MSNPVFYPRSVERRLVEAFEDSPVARIYGPRQYGKTTLVPVTCVPRPRRRPNTSTPLVHKPTVSTDASRCPEEPEFHARTNRFIVDNSRLPRSATVNSPAVLAMKSSAFTTRSAPRPSP